MCLDICLFVALCRCVCLRGCVSVCMVCVYVICVCVHVWWYVCGDLCVVCFVFCDGSCVCVRM